MAELSIKITIANRSYPLTIDSDEEENVRTVAKLIQDKLTDLETNYGVRDKQDLLAMTALQLVTELMVTQPEETKKEDPQLAEKLKELDEYVAGLV